VSKKVFCIFLHNSLVDSVPNYIFWKLFKWAIHRSKVCWHRGKQSWHPFRQWSAWAQTLSYPKRLVSEKVFCVFLDNLLVNLVPNYIFWKLFKWAIHWCKVCWHRGKQSWHPLDSGHHCARTVSWTATSICRLVSEKVFCIFLNNLLVNSVSNYIFWKLFNGAIQLCKVCLDRGKQSWHPSGQQPVMCTDNESRVK
jgi:hypothetical protein